MPLSRILTIENKQKQIAPNPTNTRAGTKNALSYTPSSNRKAAKNKHNKAVSTGINGIRLAKAKLCFHTLANKITLLEMLKQTNPKPIMMGLGLVCFSISSKVILLAKVWKQSFALANRIPLIPVLTALLCLFLAAFLFEEGVYDNAFFVPARVLVGLGAICFCLFSIVSILESGTSKK